MIELCETEVNAVSGGNAAYVVSYSGSEAGAIIRAFNAGERYDPFAYATAAKLNAYREANPDSPTWYADFFGL